MTKERGIHKGNRSGRGEGERRKGTEEAVGREQKAVCVHEPARTAQCEYVLQKHAFFLCTL
jgi:hypothetical protein